MKIRNNNPLDLEGNDGEVIIVEVRAFGTNHAVNYNLDGIGGRLNAAPNLVFTLNKATHDPSILVMFFTFTTNNGGVYEIELTGSAGGRSHYTVTQLPNLAANAIAYTIDVI